MHKNYYASEYIKDLRDLLERGERNYGLGVAYKEMDKQRKIHDYTFVELKSDVDALGTRLLSMGFKGKHFAIVGESTYSYVVSYLAVACGVGVIVPLDRELSIEELHKLICKSDAEVLLFSNSLQEDVTRMKGQCPELHTFINISSYEVDTEDLTLEELIKEGRGEINGGNHRFRELPIDRHDLPTSLHAHSWGSRN